MCVHHQGCSLHSSQTLCVSAGGLNLILFQCARRCALSQFNTIVHQLAVYPLSQQLSRLVSFVLMFIG